MSEATEVRVTRLGLLRWQATAFIREVGTQRLKQRRSYLRRTRTGATDAAVAWVRRRAPYGGPILMTYRRK